MNPTSYDVQWMPKRGESSPQDRAQAMKGIYIDAEGILSHNVPIPLSESIDINVFIDADHDSYTKIIYRFHSLL